MNHNARVEIFFILILRVHSARVRLCIENRIAILKYLPKLFGGIKERSAAYD